MHQVTLGHRRLSIVDLSPAGHQPMHTPSGMHTIVFNGEIYNHQELRQQYSGTRFRGHSDTETMLHHLAQTGMGGMTDLNGIFAFALLNEAESMLYLARDPFGVKPLYYYAHGDQFLFSSELRPLQEKLKQELDPDSLVELLRLRYLPAPDTLFQHIHKVRPGHLLTVNLRNAHLAVQEFPFFVPPSSQETPTWSDQQAVTRYGELVTKAVERQLMSDVPIGVLLSGGVDCALIAQIAQQQSDYRLKAFTVGFAEKAEADEIVDAKETARALGLEHHFVRLSRQEFLDTLPRAGSVVEEPLATTSVIPMFALSKLAASHVKVVLSGQGPDEAMGGYRRYQSELLRSYLPGFAFPLLRTRSPLPFSRSETLARALRCCGIEDDLERFESVYSVFEHDQILRLTGYASPRAHDRIQYTYDWLMSAQRKHGVERMMSIDLRMSLADDLLLYTDKITMHHSIECRVPFLDLPLIQFVESLPAHQRLGVLRGKQLHRRYCARMLPKQITRRKKKGFASPTRRWFRESTDVWDILLDSRSAFAHYFNLDEVRLILQQHRSGLNRERHIFLLLSIHCWMAEFCKTVTEDTAEYFTARTL